MSFGSLSKAHDRLWRKSYLEATKLLQQAHADYKAGRCWQATMRAHHAAAEAGKAVAHVEADRTARRGARSMARSLESLAFSAQVAIGRKCLMHETTRTSSESEFDWFATQNRTDVDRLRKAWNL